MWGGGGGGSEPRTGIIYIHIISYDMFSNVCLKEKRCFAHVCQLLPIMFKVLQSSASALAMAERKKKSAGGAA